LEAAWRVPILPDNYTFAILGTVVLASVLPASGQVAQGFEWLTVAAVSLLFFLHGAKLSRDAVLAGIGHWRLHLVVVASTLCCSRCWAGRCGRCCSRW
jgi:sodium/bile acid cotransporter 7